MSAWIAIGIVIMAIGCFAFALVRRGDHDEDRMPW